MLVVGNDHGHAVRLDRVGEQAQLGRQIGFERRVIVEMVAAEIGGAGRHPHAVEAMLVEPVQGRFDRKTGHALAGQLVERAPAPPDRAW